MFCFGFGHEACGIPAPWQGIKLKAPVLVGEDLTTRPPGKSQELTISIKVIESINNLPEQKALDPCGFTGEFYWTVKDKIISILYSLFKKIEAEEVLPNYILWDQHYPNTKTGQRH